MENSYCFYENRECKYYPCHNGLEQINCMFCFCPLYTFERCLGSYVMLSDKNVIRKDCSKCTFPHNPDNYETIIDFIRLSENKTNP